MHTIKTKLESSRELDRKMKKKYKKYIDENHLQTVWSPEAEPNMELCFICQMEKEQQVVMEWIAKDICNVYINNEFVVYGPCRAAKGYARLERLSLDQYLTREQNEIAVYVQADYTNLLYHTKEHPYFGARILVGDQTRKTTRDFQAYRMADKLQKVERMSSQRGFLEVYQMQQDRRWKEEESYVPVSMVDVQAPLLLKRNLPYGKNEYTVAERIREGYATQTEDRSWENDLTRLLEEGSSMGGYPRKDCDCVLSKELLQFSWSDSKAPYWAWIYKFPKVYCGKFRITLQVKEPTRLWLSYDDLLLDGCVKFNREQIIHGMKWILEPGEYTLYSQEVYSAQYIQLFADQKITFTEVGIVRIENPMQDCIDFPEMEQDLRKIVEAAKNTFAQNAYDLFTDCPSRERAGWLCDSYFLGKAEKFFTGQSRVEKNFLENYYLYENETFSHKGIIPMCYPAHLGENDYIPNWILWYVLELEDYQNRSGDIEFVALHHERIRDILDFFTKCENEEGFLEHLKGWVFVEWSKASDYVEGVNFPTNMLYARALEAAGKILGEEQLLEKSKDLKKRIHQMAYDGAVYIDNAVRRDGVLQLTENRSELCQIFAAYFEIASEEDDFYENFKDRFAGADVNLAPSALFIGGILRLMVLYRLGEYHRILSECRTHFTDMANRTGTIWEFFDESASCNHGFGSIIAKLICESVEKIEEQERRSL